MGHARGANPLTVFGHGYVAYFFALSIFAFASSHLGRWPSFGFVFGGRWSRGVHLFSVWSTLFAVCWTLMVVIAAKAVLTRLEESANLQVRTLLRLANSVVTYGAVLACGFWVLSMLGVDTTTLLASAGIASIAIGMGAKDLITDILAGLFLVFEGSMHVGDIVTIGTWRCTVTDMGVRTLEITDESHDVKIFTNSRVTEIVNMSRRKTLCAEEFELRRTVEVEEVPALVDAIIDGVTEEVPELGGTLRMAGITEITEDAYTVRLAYKVDERDRASVTLRLKNALQLLLEGGTEELEEVAGIEPGEEQPGDGAGAADDGEGATRPAPNPGEPAAPAR